MGHPSSRVTPTRRPQHPAPMSQPRPTDRGHDQHGAEDRDGEGRDDWDANAPRKTHCSPIIARLSAPLSAKYANTGSNSNDSSAEIRAIRAQNFDAQLPAQRYVARVT
jgi:hypothetical protein